jgi:hypothetical protein
LHTPSHDHEPSGERSNPHLLPRCSLGSPGTRLTGKAAQVGTSGRQLGVLHNEAGEAVADVEAKVAALAAQMVLGVDETRLAGGVHRTAEVFEVFRSDHERARCVSGA